MSLTQYYPATTLDGFIADPDNSLDWLFTSKREDDGPLNYGEFIADDRAIAMGSTTYEWILDHEFADKDPAEWKSPYDIPAPPHTVVVRSRGVYPADPGASRARGDAVAESPSAPFRSMGVLLSWPSAQSPWASAP